MKRKVLHISSGGLNPGGVGSVIFSIVESLAPEYDFGCAVFNRVSEKEKDFEKYGELYRIHCYPKKGKRDYLELITRPFKLYFGVRRICKKEAFDVIHCHNQHDAWPCLLAAKHVGVPIRISHAHVGMDSRKHTRIGKFLKSRAIKRLNRYATVRVACSSGAGKLLFGENAFTVIQNSIDLETFSRKTERARSLNFIHVGRFTYAKNQEFVLETFAEICKVYGDARLYLVGYGEPDAVEKLFRLIHELKLSQNVEMVPGDVANIPEYYEKSDYMIFPSRFEGFGIVLLEAQAMGIRCYGSEIIPQEADVGLLTVLPLSDGPRKWAERIVSDIQNGTEQSLDRDKLYGYGNEAICRRYAAIYNGEAELTK